MSQAKQNNCGEDELTLHLNKVELSRIVKHLNTLKRDHDLDNADYFEITDLLDKLEPKVKEN